MKKSDISVAKTGFYRSLQNKKSEFIVLYHCYFRILSYFCGEKTVIYRSLKKIISHEYTGFSKGSI